MRVTRFPFCESRVSSIVNSACAAEILFTGLIGKNRIGHVVVRAYTRSGISHLENGLKVTSHPLVEGTHATILSA